MLSLMMLGHIVIILSQGSVVSLFVETLLGWDGGVGEDGFFFERGFYGFHK